MLNELPIYTQGICFAYLSFSATYGVFKSAVRDCGIVKVVFIDYEWLLRRNSLYSSSFYRMFVLATSNLDIVVKVSQSLPDCLPAWSFCLSV